MPKQIVPVGMKSRITFLLPLILLALSFNACCVSSAEDIYGGLKQKLIRDGFQRRQVASAFKSASRPMFRLVSHTMKIRETKANYAHFLEPSEIAAAKQFIARHRNCFLEEEAEYGVEPEIIAAILLVESHFGSSTGRTPTFAILSTFAVMDRKANRDKVWKQLSVRDRREWGRRAFDRKLIERSAWAYRELSALLKLENIHEIRLRSLRGSIMGAIGWPQFLPSSLVEFGVDGNGDGRIDLYNAEDAIFSTANYLCAHGWRKAAHASDRKAVIWDYNHSKPYVSTVLKIAEKTVQGEK